MDQPFIFVRKELLQCWVKHCTAPSDVVQLGAVVHRPQPQLAALIAHWPDRAQSLASSVEGEASGGRTPSGGAIATCVSAFSLCDPLQTPFAWSHIDVGPCGS